MASSWTFAALPAAPLVLGFDGLSPGVATVSLTLMNGSQVICRDEVLITVIDLDVRWFSWDPVTMSPGTQIIEPNAHPTAAVGLRHFPDAPEPEGNWNRIVAAVIHTFPPTSGVPIWLRAFDPDDPSDNVEPVDANGSDGSDNRGTDGGLFGETVTVQATTLPGLGYAHAAFTVDVQPGDNHRVAASLKYAALERLTETVVPPMSKPPRYQVLPDDQQLPLFIGKLSRLLTTWRKLHVETDSMVRPTFVQNTWSMPWLNPRPGPVATQVEFEVDDPFTEEPILGGYQTATGQFEQGFVELNGTMVSRVLSYTDVNGDDTVLVNVTASNGIGGLTGLAGLGGMTSGTAVFSDDDLSMSATFAAKVWSCDDVYAGGGPALTGPDLSALDLRYNPAYIDPEFEAMVSGVGGITTFVRNYDFGPGSSYGEAFWDLVRPVRDLPVGNAKYWNVMVASAWQEEESDDRDPQSESSVNGINTHWDGWTTAVPGILGSNYTGMGAVFKAVSAGGAGESAIAERFTVVHEIGHTLGLPHNIVGPAGSPVDLMDDQGLGQTTPFMPLNLDRLRRYAGP